MSSLSGINRIRTAAVCSKHFLGAANMLSRSNFGNFISDRIGLSVKRIFTSYVVGGARDIAGMIRENKIDMSEAPAVHETNIRAFHLLESAKVNELNELGAGKAPLNFNFVFIKEKNLRGLKLENASFAGATFRKVDLTDADLPGANFIGADFGKVFFTGANLKNADLEGARFHKVIFAGADMRGSRFKTAHFIKTDILNAVLY